MTIDEVYNFQSEFLKRRGWSELRGRLWYPPEHYNGYNNSLGSMSTAEAFIYQVKRTDPFLFDEAMAAWLAIYIENERADS